MQPLAENMEVWKPIAGYEGLYEVSHLGRVRSLDRVVPFRTGKKRFSGQLLRLHDIGRGGYKQVTLFRNGRRDIRAVHRLVLEAFVGPSSLEVNHIDFDPANNHLGNLEYVTHAANIRHTADAGRGHAGTGHHFNKLTEEQVREVRRLRGKVSQRKLAKRFGVSQTAIYYIQSGQNWKRLS